MEQMKFVFISHKNDVSPDAEICIRLYDYLTSQGICCWMDRKDMRHSSWEKQINEKMFAATAYILVASESSLLSPRVQDEIELMTKTEKPIIPFSLDDFYSVPDVRKGAANLQIGVGRLESVILKNYKSEKEAFESLIHMLQPLGITQLKNNAADFIVKEGVLVKYTGHDAFVEIPAFMHEIADGAFKNNSDIKSVRIPVSVQKIGKRAFFGCKNLSQVDGMEGIIEADNSAFNYTCLIPNDNSGIVLNGVLFGEDAPDGGKFPAATIVAQNSFYGCTAKELEFEEGLKRVGESAFTDCYNLKRIIFPSTLEEICEGAFSHCGKLQEVIFKGTPPENAQEIFRQAKITEEK